MSNMKRLVKNAVKCLKCAETIESLSTYHFVSCRCGAVSIDGGLTYSRILGNREDFEDHRRWLIPNSDQHQIISLKEPTLLLNTLKFKSRS